MKIIMTRDAMQFGDIDLNYKNMIKYTNWYTVMPSTIGSFVGMCCGLYPYETERVLYESTNLPENHRNIFTMFDNTKIITWSGLLEPRYFDRIVVFDAVTSKVSFPYGDIAFGTVILSDYVDGTEDLVWLHYPHAMPINPHPDSQSCFCDEINTLATKFPHAEIVVTADHGVLRGEMGCYDYGWFIWEPVIKVPLYIINREQEYRECDLLGSHKDFIELILGKPHFRDVVVCETLYRGQEGRLIGVRSKDWKLIYNVDKNQDELFYFGEWGFNSWGAPIPLSCREQNNMLETYHSRYRGQELLRWEMGYVNSCPLTSQEVTAAHTELRNVVTEILTGEGKMSNSHTKLTRLYWEHFYASTTPDIQAPSTFALFCLHSYLGNRKTLVDLGCGNGRDTKFFRGLGVDTLGVDLYNNPDPDIGKFLCADFTRLATDPGKFDIIYSRFSIHAINERAEGRVLRWAKESLAPEGLFCIEARTDKDPLCGCGVSMGCNAWFTDHYRRFLSYDKFQQKLTRNGFKILFAQESSGLSIRDEDDPVLLRIICTSPPI